jgi:adenine-specific DNA-methyltransferase
MRYLGSKNESIENIMDLVSNKIAHGSFCDPFGGIGVVGSHFKRKGFKVTSGDILTFPHYFQISRIALNSQPKFSRLYAYYDLKNISELEDIINKASLQDGWFIENYAKKRKFFTLENAYRIEGAKKLIYGWDINGLLDKEEKAYLLASLINSLDKVANTAGTYYAYLKYWYRKALRPFQFEFLPITEGNNFCNVHKCDALDLVRNNEFDVLYLDPPYNARNYARYYHLPETIANQEEYNLNGKSGMPEQHFVSSEFNSSSKALKGLSNIVSSASFKYLIFHYTDYGIIKREEILDLFHKFGDIEEFVLNNKKGYTTKKGKSNFTQKVYFVKYA